VKRGSIAKRVGDDLTFLLIVAIRIVYSSACFICASLYILKGKGKCSHREGVAGTEMHASRSILHALPPMLPACNGTLLSQGRPVSALRTDKRHDARCSAIHEDAIRREQERIQRYSR
jgi:hypothetical protein